MPHSHAHSHRRGDDAPDVALARGPVTVLLVFLALCGVAAVIGVVALWPDSGAVSRLQDKAQFAAPGVTFEKAGVESVQDACPAGDKGQTAESATCGNLEAVLDTGPEKGATQLVGVPPAVSSSAGSSS